MIPQPGTGEVRQIVIDGLRELAAELNGGHGITKDAAARLAIEAADLLAASGQQVVSLDLHGEVSQVLKQHAITEHRYENRWRAGGMHIPTESEWTRDFRERAAWMAGVLKKVLNALATPPSPSEGWQQRIAKMEREAFEYGVSVGRSVPNGPPQARTDRLDVLFAAYKAKQATSAPSQPVELVNVEEIARKHADHELADIHSRGSLIRHISAAIREALSAAQIGGDRG